MRGLVAAQGLDREIEVDSAGTGGWHAGEPPDERASAAAQQRGIDLIGQAREVRPEDFIDFDLLVAMDENNIRRLAEIAPPGTEDKLVMLGDVEIPDPYYGPRAQFDEVLDMIEVGCRALLDELRQA